MEKDSSHDALRSISPDVIRTLQDNRERFRTFLSRRLGSDAIADELLQQSLLKAVEAELNLRERESVIPWFYRILRNALIDYYRAHATESKRNELLLRELQISGNDRSGSSVELQSAICQCLAGLLDTLNPGYADIVRKIDLEEKAPESVAAELGITTNNLWVKLHRARKALRKSLERSCGACSKHACLDCTCK